MTMYTNIRFDADGFILADGPDGTICCPDNMSLAVRQDIEKSLAGEPIPAYSPPIPTPEEQRKLDFPNLEPDQFWFVVRASGYEPELLAWIDAMKAEDSPVNWAAASAKLQFAKFFERDHAFVEAAREAIGMSPAELDSLWQFGAR